MDMDEQFLKCVAEWANEGIDKRLEEALNMYDEWSRDFDDEQKHMMSRLLEDFNYYTLRKVNSILQLLHKEAVEKYEISNQDTVVSVVRKKRGLFGSSSLYWLNYIYSSGMSEEIFYDTLDEIGIDEWINIKKVVFIDDCSGSGETFIKFMKRQRQSFVGKEIILITIEMMEAAKNSIENYAINNGLKIHVMCYNLKEKALHKFSKEEVNMFVTLSEKRNIESDYVKGYNSTEALMAFYNNTPNNTLGIFWAPTSDNKPIFPRKFDEKPGWKTCNTNKNKRNKQRYNAKK